MKFILNYSFVTTTLNQGWQVFARRWKKRFFHGKKTGWQKPIFAGKNRFLPEYILLQ